MGVKGTNIVIASDTLTDAATVNMDINDAFSSSYTLSVTIKSTNVTGTTAGTAKLQQSVNGTDFADIAGLTDLTLTDGATTVWSINSTPAYKYRINVVGSGTQSTTLEGSYIYK